MIRVNAFFKAHEGQFDAALSAALALTAASQNHAGCIAYDVFESATRPDVLLFCESWSDQAALDAHSQSKEFRHFAAQLQQYGELSIEILSR